MSLIGIGAYYSVDMDQIDLASLTTGVQVSATSTLYGVNVNGEVTYFEGTGFTYDGLGIPLGGIVNHIQDQYGGHVVYDITDIAVPAASFVQWAYEGDNLAAKLAVLSGSDTIFGGPGDDLLRSYSGNDSIAGSIGNDTLDAGSGSDTVTGGIGSDVILASGGGSTYLRGDDGADSVSGGTGFDDINGNMGDDTVHGNDGDDWAVGGKDNDLLYGDNGADIVYGNLGNDTCLGGEGNDLVRGGQGDDTLSGGNGADWMSGDRGNDTISGGAGADIFHTFSGAGTDRVTDFSVAQGDKVQVDFGTNYSVSQVGGDTVVDMGAGDQLILVGVQMSTLPQGWIFTL